MKNISQIIKGALILVLVSFSITGCMKKVPVQKTRTVSVISMDLDKNESTPTTQDGITITVNAIHPDNIERYASLLKKVHYQWYRYYSNGKHVLNSDGTYAVRQGTLNMNLLAYPTFEVKITNSTKHVLRFSKAVIAVEDSNGNTYDALVKSDLNDYLKQNIHAQLDYSDKYKLNDGEDSSLMSQMRSIRLLDNNLKVLPGKTVKAYVAVNYGKYTTKEAREFLIGQEKISLGIYEVPSQVDKAGDPTKTTNFNFVFDVNVKQKKENYTVYVYK